MDKKIIIAILALSALALVIGILIPGGDGRQTQMLPWKIELMPDGSTRVFGLVLSQSSVQQAEQQLRSAAKIVLIAAPDKPLVAEAYFDNVNPGGFSAQIVLEIDVPPEQTQTLFEHGERVSTLASGARKITLNDADLAMVRSLPIASITYLPRVRLQPDVIQQRFGEPVQRMVEPDSDTTHWLYPELGLDVALDDQGHAVLQYVSPTEFSRLRRPLTESGL